MKNTVTEETSALATNSAPLSLLTNAGVPRSPNNLAHRRRRGHAPLHLDGQALKLVLDGEHLQPPPVAADVVDGVVGPQVVRVVPRRTPECRHRGDCGDSCSTTSGRAAGAAAGRLDVHRVPLSTQQDVQPRLAPSGDHTRKPAHQPAGFSRMRPSQPLTASAFATIDAGSTTRPSCVL
jgi:hypothetical protein